MARSIVGFHNEDGSLTCTYVEGNCSVELLNTRYATPQQAAVLCSMGELSIADHGTPADDIAYKVNAALFGCRGAYAKLWRGEGWGYTNDLVNEDLGWIIALQPKGGAVGGLEHMQALADRYYAFEGYYFYHPTGWQKYTTAEFAERLERVQATEFAERLAQATAA